jgi:chemotaxis protein MotB
MIVGFSYCGSYKGRSQRLSDALKSKNAENENLIGQVRSLSEELETTKGQFKAKATEADMLQSALSDLRTQVKAVAAEKDKVEQEKLSLEGLTDSLKQEIEAKEIKITELEGKLTVNLMDKVLFDSGRAEIKRAGREVLDKIAKNLLNKYPDRAILVEGHTDNVPIGGELRVKFPTNWELSTARATAAVRYLQDHGGVVAERLSAIGYSEYRPIASNDTEEGKAKNRRIEIILLPPGSPLAK